MTSQVQDVVVAGSQSSNFLLPKENSGKASRVQGRTMVGLYSDWPASQTKTAEVSGLLGGGAGIVPYTPMMGLTPTVLLTLYSHSLLSIITCSIIAFLVMTMKISHAYKLNYDIRAPNKSALQWSIYTCDVC